MSLQLQIQRVRPEVDADLPLPRQMTRQAAGMDLCAAVTQPLSLEPGEFRLIPTGFAMAIPEGYEGQVRPRSGLAARHGITLLNSPGTIDADYRGEVKVILVNHGPETFIVERGMRIAQLVIGRVPQINVSEVITLSETQRGSGGFGSTGTQASS